MSKQLSESDFIRFQIQAYEFYAGLIDRAVIGGAHEAIMPRWDEQRAVEYRLLASSCASAWPSLKRKRQRWQRLLEWCPSDGSSVHRVRGFDG